MHLAAADVLPAHWHEFVARVQGGARAHVLSALQVVRLSSQDVPTAYAYELEAATIVQPEQVVEAVQKVVSGAPALAYA